MLIRVTEKHIREAGRRGGVEKLLKNMRHAIQGCFVTLI
jgi:hypothetical protein